MCILFKYLKSCKISPAIAYFSTAPFEGFISGRAYNYYSEGLMHGENLSYKRTNMMCYCTVFALFLLFFVFVGNFLIINLWTLRYRGAI